MAAKSAKLRTHAESLAAKDISKTTIAASIAIVKRTVQDSGRGTIGEPAADLQAIRSDPQLTATILNDVRTAKTQAQLLIVGALAAAYREQVENMGIKGVEMTVTFDQQTRNALTNYPIIGQSSIEHAEQLADKLRRETYRAITMPVVGQADPFTLAEQLGLVAEQHAQRVGVIVEEAYFSGAQAGLKDAAKALTGQA